MRGLMLALLVIVGLITTGCVMVNVTNINIELDENKNLDETL